MKSLFLIVGSALSVAIVSSAHAQPLEIVKVATTSIGLWDTTQPTFCKERGEFARAGLDVQIISTRGGSENVQAVIAGGMDIGYSPGLNSVLAAYAHGAKIKVISREAVGQDENFFYVPTDSPIKSAADLNGKTVAFSRPGGATEAVLLAFAKEKKVNIKPVATGAMDATYTMAMTRQIDVGYGLPPSMLTEVRDGKIRILFTGEEVATFKNVSVRVIVASSEFMQKRRAVAKKFLEVLDQCIDWAYANPQTSLAMYANFNKVDVSIAEKALTFYPRETVSFGPLSRFEEMQQQSIDGKFIEKPLTPAQRSDLIDIIYPSK